MFNLKLNLNKSTTLNTMLFCMIRMNQSMKFLLKMDAENVQSLLMKNGWLWRRKLKMHQEEFGEQGEMMIETI